MNVVKNISVSMTYGRGKKTQIKRRDMLKKMYGFEILDELISSNLHLLLVRIDKELINSIKTHPYVHDIEDTPRISF